MRLSIYWNCIIYYSSLDFCCVILVSTSRSLFLEQTATLIFVLLFVLNETLTSLQHFGRRLHSTSRFSPICSFLLNFKFCLSSSELQSHSHLFYLFASCWILLFCCHSEIVSVCSSVSYSYMLKVPIYFLNITIKDRMSWCHVLVFRIGRSFRLFCKILNVTKFEVHSR